MALPNPEERRIFMDAPDPTCSKCINSDKKEDEEPCVQCKWLTGIMGDPDFYMNKEDKNGKRSNNNSNA